MFRKSIFCIESSGIKLLHAVEYLSIRYFYRHNYKGSQQNVSEFAEAH